MLDDLLRIFLSCLSTKHVKKILIVTCDNRKCLSGLN